MNYGSHDQNTLGIYQDCLNTSAVWLLKGNTQMFMTVTFGLYFALIGLIAWDDYRHGA
jgi:hypothetical protein